MTFSELVTELEANRDALRKQHLEIVTLISEVADLAAENAALRDCCRGVNDALATLAAAGAQ